MIKAQFNTFVTAYGLSYFCGLLFLEERLFYASTLSLTVIAVVVTVSLIASVYHRKVEAFFGVFGAYYFIIEVFLILVNESFTSFTVLPVLFGACWTFYKLPAIFAKQP